MKLCESAPCLVLLFTSFTICEGTSFLILDARKTFATDEFIKPYHRLKPFHQAPEGRVLIRRAKPEHSLTCNLSKWSCQPHSRDFNVISLSLTGRFVVSLWVVLPSLANCFIIIVCGLLAPHTLFVTRPIKRVIGRVCPSMICYSHCCP